MDTMMRVCFYIKEYCSMVIFLVFEIWRKCNIGSKSIYRNMVTGVSIRESNPQLTGEGIYEEGYVS